MNPVDTGHKLNVLKTLEDVLDVLCRFSLRPVPTGKIVLIFMVLAFFMLGICNLQIRGFIVLKNGLRG